MKRKWQMAQTIGNNMLEVLVLFLFGDNNDMEEVMSLRSQVMYYRDAIEKLQTAGMIR